MSLRWMSGWGRQAFVDNNVVSSCQVHEAQGVSVMCQ